MWHKTGSTSAYRTRVTITVPKSLAPALSRWQAEDNCWSFSSSTSVIAVRGEGETSVIGVKIYLTEAITVLTPGLTRADPVPPEPSEMGHGLSGDEGNRHSLGCHTSAAYPSLPTLCHPLWAQRRRSSPSCSRGKTFKTEVQSKTFEILSCILFKHTHTHTQSHIYTYRKFRL